MGKFGLADLALIVLLFETAGFCPFENAWFAGFLQILMGLAVPGFFRLFFTLGAIRHVHPLPAAVESNSPFVTVPTAEGPAIVENYLQRMTFSPSAKSTTIFFRPDSRCTRPRPNTEWLTRDLTL
jgi:hypothetical protein